MPTILAQLAPGGPMHEFVHYRMAQHYHAAAKRHAAAAYALSSADSRLHRRWESLRTRLLRIPEPWRSLVPQSLASELAEHSVLGLVYSAMSVEAYANEIAEELIPYKDLSDFDFCRGDYEPPKKFGRVSRPAWKWKLLFERVGRPIDLSDPLLIGVERVANDRNSLVHYQMSKSATTIVHKPPREENGMWVMWEAGAEPERVVESRVPKLLQAESAAGAERAIEDLLTGWRAAESAWRAKRSAPTP